MSPTSVFTRVLHTNTHVNDLRNLLNREWTTIGVVAGLLVLLEGASARAALFDDASPGFTAVRYVFLVANTVAYMTSMTSCVVSLFLVHSSNAVPKHKLHAFLRSLHRLLWVPLGSLLVAVVAESVANSCATLAIYGSWAAFGARFGVSIAWLAGLGAAIARLSRAAQRNTHEPAALADVEAG